MILRQAGELHRQVDRFADSPRPVGDGACVGVDSQLSDNLGNPPGSGQRIVQTLGEVLFDGRRQTESVELLRQHLEVQADKRQRIVDLVGHTRGKLPDAGEPLSGLRPMLCPKPSGHVSEDKRTGHFIASRSELDTST